MRGVVEEAEVGEVDNKIINKMNMKVVRLIEGEESQVDEVEGVVVVAEAVGKEQGSQSKNSMIP